MLKLKSFIRENLPNCQVFICASTLRTDHGKASLTMSNLAKNILQLKLDVVDNYNRTNGVMELMEYTQIYKEVVVLGCERFS